MKIILLILIAYSFIYADLSRSENSVSDSTTNLQWQDNTVITKTWIGAIDYCESLTLDGASDWRLPNKKELLSIADRSRYNPAIDTNAFVNIASSLYWSSTTCADHTNDAWFVYFYYGNSDYYDKSRSGYVRCVRGGQVDNGDTNQSINPSVIQYLLD